MADMLKEFCTAVSADLAWLAQLQDAELDRPALAQLNDSPQPLAMSLRLNSEAGVQAMELLDASLRQMHTASDAEIDALAADFAAIYLNYGYDVSPYESVWIDEDSLIMQEPMFQIRQWYQHYGLQAQDWRLRSEDHLVCQLQFLATVFSLASTSALADAARFMDEHTLRWLMDFGQRIAARADTAFYASLAMLSAAYLDELRDLLATILNEPRPTPEEVEQRLKAANNPVVEEPVRFVPGAAPGW